jgi:hypothetical protein
LNIKATPLISSVISLVCSPALTLFTKHDRCRDSLKSSLLCFCCLVVTFICPSLRETWDEVESHADAPRLHQRRRSRTTTSRTTTSATTRSRAPAAAQQPPQHVPQLRLPADLLHLLAAVSSGADIRCERARDALPHGRERRRLAAQLA